VDLGDLSVMSRYVSNRSLTHLSARLALDNCIGDVESGVVDETEGDCI
jgi:hypothetical protein